MVNKDCKIEKENNNYTMKSIANIIAKVGLIAIGVFVLVMLFANAYNRDGKDPERFVYNKHDYLYFKGKGLVHDPDCRHCFIVFD